ncbi:hypothetical protein PHMEG_00015624 [Phytophthora megakarya]|uniref:CCHC-type domain-containing protein n=1 Tax=Phytophthora megakarya TaxID=4795 RepID=A0A225W0Y7_9STRA|nr:hypothetical protein PHMEG_00015624 [Phytophthora megakarya]
MAAAQLEIQTAPQNREDTRTCNACGKVDHIARVCPNKTNRGSERSSEPRMLQDWEAVDDLEGVKISNGLKLKTTRRGTLKLQVFVDGEFSWVVFKNACYAPTLAVNLISFGVLLENGCLFETRQRKYAITKYDEVVMYVYLKNNVLMLDQGVREQKVIQLSDVIMTVVSESAPPQNTMLKASLHEFHVRFGHLNYDDVERMARTQLMASNSQTRCARIV